MQFRTASAVFRVCAGLILTTAAGSASAQSINVKTFSDTVGCWETFGAARDIRALCISQDRRATIKTDIAGTVGACAIYPVAPVRLEGGSAVIAVTGGKNNCKLADGSVVGSNPGRLVCDLDSGKEHLVCRTTWTGWEPITEVYRRQK